MRVRIARINDTKEIYRIYINAIKKTCKNFYTKKQIKVWLEGKSPESYLEGINRKDMFVVEDNHKIIGLGRAIPGEILAIYVDPASHKKGAGKLLLDYGMKIALKGHKKLKVISTVNAEGFYKKHGFVKIKDSFRTIHGVDAPQVIMEYSSVSVDCK